MTDVAEAVVDQRSRFVHHRDHRALVLLNYKCGFTTLSAALSADDGWQTDLRNKKLLRAAVADGQFDDHDVHMVVRDPQKRIASFYWNWFVAKDAHFSGRTDTHNAHFANLRRRAGETEYQAFANASSDERATPEFFDRYLGWLMLLWPDNDHTAPQFRAYADVGIAAGRVTIWHMDQIDDLCAVFGTPPPKVRNASSGLDHKLLDTPTARRICSLVYRRDYLEFDFSIPTGKH